MDVDLGGGVVAANINGWPRVGARGVLPGLNGFRVAGKGLDNAQDSMRASKAILH